MIIAYIIVAFILGGAISTGSYIFLHKRSLNGKKEEIIRNAEIEGENIKKEKIYQAKEQFLQLKSEHEQHVNEKNNQIRETENRLKQKENSLNQQNSELGRKIKQNENIKESLRGQIEANKLKAEEYEALKDQVNRQIESIAGMSAAEAKNQLM